MCGRWARRATTWARRAFVHGAARPCLPRRSTRSPRWRRAPRRVSSSSSRPWGPRTSPAAAPSSRWGSRKSTALGFIFRARRPGRRISPGPPPAARRTRARARGPPRRPPGRARAYALMSDPNARSSGATPLASIFCRTFSARTTSPWPAQWSIRLVYEATSGAMPRLSMSQVPLPSSSRNTSCAAPTFPSARYPRSSMLKMSMEGHTLSHCICDSRRRASPIRPPRT